MFRHIHIVGCSDRSGTTLLHEAMVACFRIDQRYEHEARFNEVTARDGQIVLSKRPRDTRYISRALGMNQNLFVIYMLRDPRDAICSHHDGFDEAYFTNIPIWRELHSFGRKLYGHERFLKIRYEDLTRDPSGIQTAIVAKWPWLEPTHDFAEYHLHAVATEGSQIAMHGVRPISPTSVGIWRRHLERVKGQQLMHGSLTPDLIECGYEPNADWERLLDGVEPDLSRSYLSERGRIWRLVAGSVVAALRTAEYRRRLRQLRST
jgi:hypothetical protein